MLNFPSVSRRLLTMLTAAAAATALTAGLASTASAETRLSVGLDAGVLSITGTEINDITAVFKQPSASSPGGYVLTVSILNTAVPNLPASCSTAGTFGKWLVSCSALNVSKITFDGKLGGDGFVNNTGLPS